MNRIDIPNWFQVDFDITVPKKTLEDILKLMQGLISKKLVDKWFYLFEVRTIRVRMHTSKSSSLTQMVNQEVAQLGLVISTEHPFEGYWETTDVFEDITVVKAFADIMSTLTALSVTRFKGKALSNYRLVERLSHCIFNNVYGLPTEEYFLLKRLLERLGSNLGNLNDDPEQTILSDSYKLGSINSATIKIPSIKIPLK